MVLGIGGSATTDGGAGLLRALGAEADRDRASADLAGLDPRLAGVDLAVACDVSNPLLGPTGAAAVYGPQKGATPADVAELERRLEAFADAFLAVHPEVDESRAARFTLERIYRHFVSAMTEILAQHEDEASIRQAVAQFSTYHLAGMKAFLERKPA